MYESFRGHVVRHRPTELVLEIGGIAYRFAVPLSTSDRTPHSGETTLLAHLVVREDKLDLVGFATDAERRLFRMLIAVSGIGPAVALGVLSRAPVDEFLAAIRDENRAYLNAIKGVGKKTAERMLVELAEPVQKWGFEPSSADATSTGPTPPAFDEAVAALGTLGLAPAMAKKAVERAFKDVGDDAPLEAIVRSALSGV